MLCSAMIWICAGIWCALQCYDMCRYVGYMVCSAVLLIAIRKQWLFKKYVCLGRSHAYCLGAVLSEGSAEVESMQKEKTDLNNHKEIAECRTDILDLSVHVKDTEIMSMLVGMIYTSDTHLIYTSDTHLIHVWRSQFTFAYHAFKVKTFTRVNRFLFSLSLPTHPPPISLQACCRPT